MARVTVEDCLKHVESNYALVLQASKRARKIAEGAEPLVERDNDKPCVIALREIADNVVRVKRRTLSPPIFIGLLTGINRLRKSKRPAEPSLLPRVLMHLSPENLVSSIYTTL